MSLAPTLTPRTLSPISQAVDNVLKISRAKDIARVHYWQTINNELLSSDIANNVAGLCSGNPPNYNPASQNGYWTTLPNGTLSDVGQYFQDIIAGRKPMPKL